MIEKDLIYVENVWTLVVEICEQRGLNPNSCIIRVGVDGGQGSLKLVINIFDPDNLEDIRDIKLTGVNKAIIIGFVKDIKETNFNIGKILEYIKLDTLKHYIAADLKLINCLLGLSVSFSYFIKFIRNIK